MAMPTWLEQKTGRWLVWAAGYLGLYLLLDWVSNIEPYGVLDLTPWNPPAGLSLALLLAKGFSFAPLVFVAGVAADGIVRSFAAPIGPTLLADLVPALGYTAAAYVLRWGWLRFDLRLFHLRDIVLLLGVAAAASIPVAAGYIWIFRFGGQIQPDDLGMQWFRYWIGDMIGIAIFTPLFLTLSGQAATAAPKSATNPIVVTLQGLSILLSLWFVFGGDLSQHPQLYYPLFMPLVWVGAWYGLRGVGIGLFATQIGLIIAIQEARIDAETLTEVQFFLLALTLTSLFLGATATERRRANLALANSRSRLKALADLAGEGMLTVAEQGTIETVNPAFVALTGWPAAALERKTLVSLFPDLARAIEADGGQAILKTASGSEIAVVLRTTRILLADRTVIAAALCPERKDQSAS